jgi:hypothetical protein
MSDQPSNPGVEKSAFFRPGAFLLGFFAGLVLCSAIARVASHRGYHEVFTRFFQEISPEAQYYPTLEEMRGIVRMRCRPDQVLVIVGGNSIFNGVGQPAAKMWTVELQRLLGERFVVINFAFRGALCTDGGAVVAEALRKEYPRQVYVANAAPFTPPAPYGIEPYRYLFWEARSRGLLEDYAPRAEMVEEYVRKEFKWGRRFDLWGLGWLDRVLRFRDLWNLVGYECLFTIPNPITPHLPQAIWARERFADIEPDFEATPPGDRFRPEYLDAEMKIVRGFSESFYVRDGRGAWRPGTLSRLQFEDVARGAVPDDLKPRTLIMLSRNCPYYLRRLTRDERQRDDAAYRDGAAAWRKAGYEAADYGRDYADADFGDRTHLSASGGRKLAQQVAEHVQAIASKLGYINPPPPKP